MASCRGTGSDAGRVPPAWTSRPRPVVRSAGYRCRSGMPRHAAGVRPAPPARPRRARALHRTAARSPGNAPHRAGSGSRPGHRHTAWRRAGHDPASPPPDPVTASARAGRSPCGNRCPARAARPPAGSCGNRGSRGCRPRVAMAPAFRRTLRSRAGSLPAFRGCNPPDPAGSAEAATTCDWRNRCSRRRGRAC